MLVQYGTRGGGAAARTANTRSTSSAEVLAVRPEGNYRGEKPRKRFCFGHEPECRLTVTPPWPPCPLPETAERAGARVCREVAG